jgi:membrane associated rhomboid family serine protease
VSSAFPPMIFSKFKNAFRNFPVFKRKYQTDFRSYARNFKIGAFESLFAANTAIYLYLLSQSDRRELMRHTLRKYLALSIPNWREHRYYTVITSHFTHVQFMHFGFNMFMLYQTCSLLNAYLGNNHGNRHAYALYALGGLFGSIFAMVDATENPIRQSKIWHMFGASDSVAAIFSFGVALNPRQKFLFFCTCDYFNL